MLNVETETRPPEPDEEEDDDFDSARVMVHLIGSDDCHHEAAVQLFRDNASDPEQIAGAILRAALAVGRLIGPDVDWAVTKRFASYDGGLS